ncbi:helix-turn-helix domain-containing protein [Paenibacillus gorillae]|uniref:helix-turn-helix domain-containing protein n=1 Tax=Paenibacillus gorillae TaxID=1243662 RepID=UPI00138B0F2F|nr:helix-turn-helix domain-containing protein [Paenibacillus gorillae]
MREGRSYVCSPGQLVEGFLQSFDERGFYELRFDVISDDGVTGDYTDRVRQEESFPVKGEVIASSPVSIIVLCERIAEHLRRDEDVLKRFRGQIYFQELLYMILEDALLLKERDSEAALEHTKRYIEEHYQLDLKIEHLTKVAGMSERHFMRLFKKRYGCSAIEYLTIYRISQAQQLMRSGGQYRLKDIARHVGYHDDAYFRRKFTQVSGIPPAAFMRNCKLRIVAYHPAIIGQLLALKVIACAAPSDHPWTDYYNRKFERNNVLPLSTDTSLKLTELKLAAPDFIIGLDNLTTMEEEAGLRNIAPVLLLPGEEMDWRSHLTLIAQFLNKRGAADAWLEHYERRARFVAEQITPDIHGDRLLVLRINGAGAEILGRRSVSTVFYDDLRMQPAAGVEDIEKNRQITIAQVGKYHADRLLLFVDENVHPTISKQSLMRSEQWRAIPAVRNGRVDVLPVYPWTEYTAFTNELMLDEVLKLWRDRT